MEGPGRRSFPCERLMLGASDPYFAVSRPAVAGGCSVQGFDVGVSENSGYLFWRLYNKDPII